MMKIKNSDKEEMQRLCDFVRENVEKHDYEKCKEKIMRAMSEFPHAAEPHNLMGVLLGKRRKSCNCNETFPSGMGIRSCISPNKGESGSLWSVSTK